jgi:alpha-1,3-rhamnosyl/mannosyltransferase
MKIALNASTLLTPKAGIGLYTDKIARALFFSPDYDVHFFFKRYWSKNIFKQNNKNFLFDKFINKLTPKTLRFQNAIDTFYFNKYVRSRDIDLYHEPNFIAYETSIPTLITIHDLSWIHHPKFFFKEELEKFNNFFLKSINGAANIITHSNFIKKEIYSNFSYPLDRIFVVNEDVSDIFFPRRAEDCLKILNKYNLNYKKYILCINTLDLRKNYKTLITAYNSLEIKIQQEYPLIIIGMKGRYFEETINLINHSSNIIYLGHLPTDELSIILSGAAVFAYPSLYEGFGISPLEAMASGVPVISSNTSSLPEVIGNAGVLIDPLDVDLWSREIKNIIFNKDIKENLISLGLKRIKCFPKNSCVNQILNIYKLIIKKSRNI